VRLQNPKRQTSPPSSKFLALCVGQSIIPAASRIYRAPCVVAASRNIYGGPPNKIGFGQRHIPKRPGEICITVLEYAYTGESLENVSVPMRIFDFFFSAQPLHEQSFERYSDAPGRISASALRDFFQVRAFIIRSSPRIAGDSI